ncbi:eukaryotic translation initiation factor 5A-2 [Senna tora]|uniref:Eukaryotic translation initiation factor 5A-2 n=1 Tax=Senna tora TaxID=362788 RepID=A0A835CF80_9FABA|nr:eukaryotic translation initiation factor 5A-2 [Senna tora]
MSDEEHHFESKADAGASKTYPQQAGTIRKNGYIVIKGRPCKVVEVSTSKTGKHGHAKCHFVGIDIFTAKKLEDIVPSSHNCDVPHVNRTDYQLIDISEDGFVSLLTDNGNTKDDLRLPTDDNLLSQIKDGFADGKDLVVSVMSAMGEEQICALKDIGPNFVMAGLVTLVLSMVFMDLLGQSVITFMGLNTRLSPKGPSKKETSASKAAILFLQSRLAKFPIILKGFTIGRKTSSPILRATKPRHLPPPPPPAFVNSHPPSSRVSNSKRTSSGRTCLLR